MMLGDRGVHGASVAPRAAPEMPGGTSVRCCLLARLRQDGQQVQEGLERRAQNFALLGFVVGVGFITNWPRNPLDSSAAL